MKSRRGVTVKNPTMEQRKAIVAIMNSQDANVCCNISDVLNEQYPWVWFSEDDIITVCNTLECGGKKYVSFKKFVKYMCQEEAEQVIPESIWKCTKELKMDVVGDVAFKDGGLYAQISNIYSLLLIDELGVIHDVGGGWEQHFYQVK